MSVLILNIFNRDAIAGAAINIAMYPPVPSSFILGGSACIGTENHCVDKTDKRYIDGKRVTGICVCSCNANPDDTLHAPFTYRRSVCKH